MFEIVDSVWPSLRLRAYSMEQHTKYNETTNQYTHSISRQFSGLWIGSRSIRRVVLRLLFSVKSSQSFLSCYLFEVCDHWRLLLKVEQYQCFVTKTVSFGEFNYRRRITN